MQNLRLAVDDWFLLNAVRNMFPQNRKLVLNLLSRLGFMINRQKSQLEPAQPIVYTGGLFDLEKGMVMPTPDRVENIQLAVTKIMLTSERAKDYLHMLGLMVSCIELIPFARLHMRRIQLHFYISGNQYRGTWKPKFQVLST